MGRIIYFEVLICFAQNIFVLILGWIMFPIWLAMFVQVLSGKEVHDSSGQGVWAFIWPMAVVIGGTIGLYTLLRVTRALRINNKNSAKRNSTLLGIVIGMASLIHMHVIAPWPAAANIENLISLLFTLILPLVATFHLIYLAQTKLWQNANK